MSKSDSQDGWRPSPQMIAAAIVLVVLIVFALLNNGSTRINLFGAKFNSPLWLWFLLMLVLGVGIGSVFPWGRRRN